jgi:dATP pyrophosphohydrolase
MIEAHIFRRIENKIEFLLLKRSDKEIYPGLWQMVSGKIKKGEKAFQTALREIQEETHLKPKKFWVVPNINSFYLPEKDSITFLPVFLVQVDNHSEVMLSDEHSTYRWVTAREAKKLLAWSGQRKSVDIIIEYLTKRKSYLNFVEIKI